MAEPKPVEKFVFHPETSGRGRENAATAAALLSQTRRSFYCG
jgi:hypothetical protein